MEGGVTICPHPWHGIYTVCVTDTPLLQVDDVTPAGSDAFEKRSDAFESGSNALDTLNNAVLASLW